MLSGIESLTHELITHPPSTELVVFDMSRVAEVLPVSRRTSSAMATKLLDVGHRIIIVDPEGTVEGFQDSEGRDIEFWSAERLGAAMG